jgi:hypothetical protein
MESLRQNGFPADMDATDRRPFKVRESLVELTNRCSIWALEVGPDRLRLKNHPGPVSCACGFNDHPRHPYRPNLLESQP